MQQGRAVLLFGVMGLLIVGTAVLQGLPLALTILNFGIISAIMALGVNLQWGFAGLLNVGIMGFVALGGLAAVLVTMPPVPEAWSAGGPRLLFGLAVGAATLAAVIQLRRRMTPSRTRAALTLGVLVVGLVIYRGVFLPAAAAVEAVNPASTGYLGGLGLPAIVAWPMGGLLAAGAAWIIGKAALGLRSDYLAIATLGISEIIIAIIKNEDWLSRGVKNVLGVPRPVPNEIDLQASATFAAWADRFGLGVVEASALFVRGATMILFLAVLFILLWMAQRALHSPWGRMMRAIRDNETAAEAMGKDVTGRHLQVFILGSAICGIAGAMLITTQGLFEPTTYQPLRFTFLVWVMVIVGGSGNNFGAVLGGLLIWWVYIQVEVLGPRLMEALTFMLADGSPLKERLLDSVQHMRFLTMGLVLLLVLRFSPRGLLPER